MLKGGRESKRCSFARPFGTLLSLSLLGPELMKCQKQASGRLPNLPCNETKESKSHMVLLSYKEKTIKKEQITLSILGHETIAGRGRWWMQGSVDPLMNSGKISSQTKAILCMLKTGNRLFLIKLL